MGIKNEQNSPALMELTFQWKKQESQQINDLLVKKNKIKNKKSAGFKCYEEEMWGSGIRMDKRHVGPGIVLYK